MLMQNIAFADNPFNECVNAVKQDPTVDWSLIDEDRIVCIEETNYIAIEKGRIGYKTFLRMPLKDSNEVFVGCFKNGKYSRTLSTEVEYIAAAEYFSKEEAISYALKAGLSKPTEIRCILSDERAWMQCYYVLCDNQYYIIPFYIIDYGTFNIMKNEECYFEIGHPYSVKEFIDFFEKENELHRQYLKELEDSGVDDHDYVYTDPETGLEMEHIAKKPNNQEQNNEAVEQQKDKTDTEPNKTNDNKKTDKPDKTDTKNADEKTDIKLSDPNEKNIGQDKFFNDVPPDHWAYDDIMTLAKNNVILGYGNNYFGVNDSVTNEQFALLLKRQFNYDEKNTSASAAKRENIIVSLIKALNPDLSKVDTSVIAADFSDGNKISDNDKPYIAYAVENKIVLGDKGKLNLENNVTRAETAALINRALKLK